jgi:hypothetical protein
MIDLTRRALLVASSTPSTLVDVLRECFITTQGLFGPEALASIEMAGGGGYELRFAMEKEAALAIVEVLHSEALATRALQPGRGEQRGAASAPTLPAEPAAEPAWANGFELVCCYRFVVYVLPTRPQSSHCIFCID